MSAGERPDLAEIRHFAAEVIGPGLWWSENVPMVRALLERAMGYFLPLIAYVEGLEVERDNLLKLAEEKGWAYFYDQRYDRAMVQVVELRAELQEALIQRADFSTGLSLAQAALEEIRRQLDLRLPSEQTGPAWSRAVRIPVERMQVIDAVLASVLDEPAHTNEPMPALHPAAPAPAEGEHHGD